MPQESFATDDRHHAVDAPWAADAADDRAVMHVLVGGRPGEDPLALTVDKTRAAAVQPVLAAAIADGQWVLAAHLLVDVIVAWDRAEGLAQTPVRITVETITALGYPRMTATVDAIDEALKSGPFR
jgi:hypothetical protein